MEIVLKIPVKNTPFTTKQPFIQISGLFSFQK